MTDVNILLVHFVIVNIFHSIGTFLLKNRGNGKMLAIAAGKIVWTDQICGEQAYWIWDHDNDIWGLIKHKV